MGCSFSTNIQSLWDKSTRIVVLSTKSRVSSAMPRDRIVKCQGKCVTDSNPIVVREDQTIAHREKTMIVGKKSVFGNDPIAMQHGQCATRNASIARFSTPLAQFCTPGERFCTPDAQPDGPANNPAEKIPAKYPVNTKYFMQIVSRADCFTQRRRGRRDDKKTG